ncbi:MAG: ABC transporter permease [Lachnospiraceae bacterium]
MAALAIELQKIHRRKIWLIVTALIGTQFLWLLWSFRTMDAYRLSQGFRHCLYNLPLINAIMMPLLISVIASRLCDIEHKGQTLKLLQTIQSPGNLFDAKFLCGALHVIATVFIQFLLILLMGKIKGFTEPLPADKLLFYLFATVSVNLTILALQQVLSLLFVNQMIALTIGLIGSFAGLFSMFFPQGWQKIILWGYYGVLMQVGMNWEKDTRFLDLYYTPIDQYGFLLLVILFLVIYAAGRFLFVRKEQ